jgi:hypothetical protein
MIPWKDPREWMEDMGSTRWKQRVVAENEGFDRSIAAAAAKLKVPFEKVVHMFGEAQEDHNRRGAWKVGGLTVTPQPGGAYLWAYGAEEPQKDSVGDLDVAGPWVIVSVDIGKGAEHYEIRAYKKRRLVWTYRAGKEGLGPAVAILGSHVYCLEAESPLRYTRLVRISLATGEKEDLLYEERNRSAALSLIKGSGRTLFLDSEVAGRQSVYWVDGAVLRQICPAAIATYPIGRWGKEIVSLVRVGSFSEPWTLWTPDGPLRKGQPLIPACFAESGIELVCPKCQIIVLKDKGVRRVVKAGAPLYSFFGEVDVNPWSAWLTGRAEVRVCIPGRHPFRICMKGWRGIIPPNAVYAPFLHVGTAKSADGTGVRWAVTSAVKKPRGLLMIVYGAYGISTYLDTARWRPFLAAGLAVAFALVRGGGDAGEIWAEAGRREGKLRGIEDTEACIRAAQRFFGLGPKETCLFGRSAGGYCVGAVVARHPAGDLVGTAYAEVPYVDVLKTAGNAGLPLTEYEYLEFGDPAHKIADFETLLRLSPIHALKKGAPGVAVLTRTGMNDMQVLAYEPVKWIDALREGGGEEKVVHVNGGAGHFTRGGQEFIERAEDLCWILEKMFK